MNIPKTNEIYKHFKGKLYKIITVATHSETGEQMVVYQALYGDYKAYVRPLAMFMEEVDHKKYPGVEQKMRFQLVEELVDYEKIASFKGEEVEIQHGTMKREDVQRIQGKKNIRCQEDSILQERQEEAPVQQSVLSQAQREEAPVQQSALSQAQREEAPVQQFVLSQAQREEMPIQQSAPSQGFQMDPLLEAYLDAASCRERLEILQQVHHRITDDMITTMAVVTDFDIPEGEIQERYEALKTCLMMRERYEI